MDVEEGNYDVTMRFGDPAAATSTTIKAESRRLMIEKVETEPGKFETRTFTVNVRKPAISTGGTTSLNGREKGPPPVPDWDDHLTFEFNGKHPGVASIEIKPAKDAITVFIAGDSTVTDQAHEPYAGWGQMLPRFFRQGVAVSNQAESGLALYSFERQKRLEKVLSMMKKGDYLFIQFGHNDQKDKSRRRRAVHDLQGEPQAVRRSGPGQGRHPGAGDPDGAAAVGRQRAAADAGRLRRGRPAGRRGGEGAGDRPERDEPEVLRRPRAGQVRRGPSSYYPANTFPGQDKPLKDNTHHNAYGGYELARCVVEGIKANVPALAPHLAKDAGTFDPAHPDPPEKVDIPASPLTGPTEKPAGS